MISKKVIQEQLTALIAKIQSGSLRDRGALDQLTELLFIAEPSIASDVIAQIIEASLLPGLTILGKDIPSIHATLQRCLQENNDRANSFRENYHSVLLGSGWHYGGLCTSYGQRGGDFITNLPIDNSQLLTLAVDGEGHGQSYTPFLQAQIASHAFREIVGRNAATPAPAQIAEQLNPYLIMPGSRLTCFCITHANLADGRIQYAAGGWPSLLLVKQDGVRTIKGASSCMGLRRSMFKNQCFYLHPGEGLALFSDGLIEVDLPGNDCTTLDVRPLAMFLWKLATSDYQLERKTAQNFEKLMQTTQDDVSLQLLWRESVRDYRYVENGHLFYKLRLEQLCSDYSNHPAHV